MLPLQFPAWDPVLIEIPGLPIDIRWYGLMYVVGFAVGHWILVRLARAGFLPLTPQQVGDFILYLVFGVLLGGRIGHTLFYNMEPFSFINLLKVWEGGLAFHGGVIGVVVAMVWFGRRHRVPWTRLADGVALGGCIGVFCVRMANFINGELYGRVTSSDTPFAMQFPTDEIAEQMMGIRGLPLGIRDRELVVQVAVGHRPWESIEDQLPELGEGTWDRVRSAVEGEDGRTGWDILRSQVDADGAHIIPFRHPSQLYEGLGEGLLLGLVLWIFYRATRRQPLGHGAYAGIFLLGYAAVRFACEFVRQPDRQFRTADDPLGTVLLGMTMGQTLSLGLVLGGILLLWWARNHRPPPRPADGGQPQGVAG